MSIVVYYTVLLFLVLMIIRQWILYHIRKKAREIVFTNVQQAMKRGDADWDEYWYQGPAGRSYNRMLFLDLHKWTFKQFYPNLRRW